MDLYEKIYYITPQLRPLKGVFEFGINIAGGRDCKQLFYQFTIYRVIMKSFSLWLVLLFASMFLLTSCKKDDNPVTPPPVTHASGSYVGMIAGGSESGVLTLNVSSSAAPKSTGTLAIINISGTLKIGSNTTTLTGTYNTTNDSLYVTGGGYSFAGTYSNGALLGTYTGPNGSGGFSTQSSSGSDPVRVYLGSSVSQVQGHTNSTLNLVVKGNNLLGLAVNPDGERTPLSGTISGLNITVTVAFGAISGTIATGTFIADFSSATGTYDTGPFNPTDADHGTWSVTLSQ
jgi:hypothetical protein